MRACGGLRRSVEEHDPHLLSRREDRPRRIGDRRRDHGFDERGRNSRRRLRIQRTVQSHDAAERGQRVGVPRADVRIGGGGTGGRPAGIGVLDHGRGRFVEFGDETPRRIKIDQIRERQLLALDDREAEWRPRVLPQRGELMRVLAVAEIAHLLQLDGRGRPALTAWPADEPLFLP